MNRSTIASGCVILVLWALFSSIYLGYHEYITGTLPDILYFQLFLIPVLIAALSWSWWSIWIVGIISTFIIWGLRYYLHPMSEVQLSNLPFLFWAPGLLLFLQSLSIGAVIFNKEKRIRKLRDELVLQISDINRQQAQFNKSELLLDNLQKNNLKLSSMIMNLTTHSRLLNEKLRAAEITKSGIEAIYRLINPDYCAIYMVPPRYAMLVLAEQRGTPLESSLPKEVPFGQGLLGRVAERQQTIKKEDSYVAESGLDSQSPRAITVAIPVSFLHKVLGVIYVEKGSAVRDELFILETLAAFIGMALHNAEVVQEKQMEAMTDGLTKLYNHEYFLERMRDAVAASRRYHRLLSLIMLDVDHFKHYNDTNGHQMGDIVLEEVAKIIKNNVRGADIAARYGGEEFAIILPDTDVRGAEKVGDKIRLTISEYYFSNRESQPLGKVTCSVGVGIMSEKISSAEELIEIADQALYRAKHNGRNRVELGAQEVIP